MNQIATGMSRNTTTAAPTSFKRPKPYAPAFKARARARKLTLTGIKG